MTSRLLLLNGSLRGSERIVAIRAGFRWRGQRWCPNRARVHSPRREGRCLL